jgi:hypothetical protein
LKIQNTSNQSTLINIRIERIHGQENLGSILIWFFDNQTNTPNTDISISNAKITNTTTGTIDFVSNYLMKPNHTYFIELAGFASMNSIEGSKITFDFAIEQSQKE